MYKIGTTYYFTNANGLQKQEAASAVTTTVKKGTKLSTAAKQGSIMAISNAAKNGTSFIYDGAKHKALAFSMSVGTIASASFAKNGSVVALIAKSGSGKSKIFLSQGTVNSLKEFALPKYATTCGVVTLSTDAKQLFVACKFNVPNKPKGQFGFVVMPVSGGKLGNEQRTVDNKEVNSAQWLSASKLITIENDANQNGTLTERVATNGKVLSSLVIGQDLQMTLAGEDAIATPWEIVASADKNTLYYSFSVYTLTDTPSYATFIGKYDTSSNVDAILLNDGTYKGMAESD